jgi:Ca-activated chloride channel homolog
MAEPIPQPPHPTPRLSLIPERGALLAGGGEGDALLRLAVDASETSTSTEQPLTLSLVIDRSGSMSGAPLGYAKQAALHALDLLRPGDAVAVVTFEDDVDVVVPITIVNGDLHAIRHAIRRIESGRSTGLHAGWVEGLTQALMFPREAGFARVILLSDGRANVGITAVDRIAAQVEAARVDTGVTTSALGLGSHYDEHLMRAIADAGGGNYSYVSEPHELAEHIETEFVSITAIRGRKLHLTFADPRARFIGTSSGSRLDDGALHLGDLLTGMPRDVLLRIAHGGDALPPLRLEFEDASLGERVALEVPLEIPFVDAATFAALPVVPEVREARNLRHFHEQVVRFEEAVADRNFPVAARVIADLQRELAGWPRNEKTEGRLRDLHDMLTAASQRDDLRARKLAHRGRYEAEVGFGRFERNMMLMADRTRRGDAGRPADRPPPQRTPRFEVQGPVGTHQLEVVVGGITHEAVDAIVNPSNRGLFGTAGVDGAVHAHGGPELTAACRQIGRIQYGEAVFTAGFRLPAKHVIHIATMAWADGQSGELDSLKQSYARALLLAGRLRCRSIAFPAVGIGTNRFPFELATTAAIRTVTEILRQHGGPERVRFVVSNAGFAERYRHLLAVQLAGGGDHAPRSIS